MSEYIDFNINHYVKVKLSESGLYELERQDKELMSKFPSIKKMSPVKVDEDGYTKFQLWDLMERLGHKCVMGYLTPFDSNIKLIKDK